MAYDAHKNRSYNYFSADDIMRWIIEEIGETAELTENIIDEAAEYGKKKLRETSPVSTDEYKTAKGEYAKSWKVRKSFPKGYNSAGLGVGLKSTHAGFLYNRRKTNRVIYNQIGRLTHILEYGTDERYTRLGYKRGRGTQRRHIENAFQDTLNYVEFLLGDFSDK